MSKTLKVLALVLVAILSLSVFAGCGEEQVVDASSNVITESDAIINVDSDIVSSDEETDNSSDEETDEPTQSQDKTDEPTESEEGDTNSKTSSRGPRPGNQTQEVVDVNLTGDKIVNEKIEFEIMGIATTAAVDFEKMSFFPYMEKRTNVKINFVGVAENKLGERKALVMQSGDYPDMFTFYYNTFSDYELYKYGKEGAIIDLAANDYLKTYAPNAWKRIETEPLQRALYEDADGHIYTMPGRKSVIENYDHWLNINKSWLKKLGLKTPTTTSEFLNVMRAFRDRDPNGNGQKDEVPFALWNWGGGFITSFWGVTIGDGNCGLDNSGKVYYAPTTENTHQACLWWNQFKTEAGLMDNSVTGSQDSFWAKFTSHIQTGKVGCFVWSYLHGASFDPELLKQFEAIPFPTANFRNPNGLNLPKVVNPYNMSQTRSGRIITKACKNVPALLRFYDLFFQDEFAAIAMYGDPAKGLFKKNSDGTYSLTAKGVKEGTDGPHWLMGLPQVNQVLGNKWKAEANVKNTEYNKYLAAANNTYRAAHKANPRYTLPKVMKTADEITKLKKFASFDNGTGRLASYVTGWVDISGWTTWVNEMNTKGVENYVKIWQGIADRNKKYISKIG